MSRGLYLLIVALIALFAIIDNVEGTGGRRRGGKKSSKKKSGSWWGNPSPTPKPTPWVVTPKPSPYPTEECRLTGTWLNRDTPEITGDWELAWKFRYEGTEVCPNGATPQDALCREVDTHVDFDDYNWGHYRYLLCDYRGFLCVDYDSSYYDECPDFEVQFCC